MSRVTGKIYRAVIRDGYLRPLYWDYRSEQENWDTLIRDNDLVLLVEEVNEIWFHVVFEDQHGWVQLDGMEPHE